MSNRTPEKGYRKAAKRVWPDRFVGKRKKGTRKGEDETKAGKQK